MFWCENTESGGRGCAKPTDNNYQRRNRERKDWPDKRMPISLCENHARDRIPLTNNQIDIIMKKIFPLLLLCLSFIGCTAQNLENIKTNLPPGSILQVGNGTVIPANPALFKGDKGDTGPQGVQGASGELIPPVGAKNGDVLMVKDGKYVPMAIEIDLGVTEQRGLTGSVDLDKKIAASEKYYVSISGEVTAINGSLTVYYSYTDTSGQMQVKNFTPVVSVGTFYPGLFLFEPKKDTEIKLYTIVQGTANYNISYNIHQQ